MIFYVLNIVITDIGTCLVITIQTHAHTHKYIYGPVISGQHYHCSSPSSVCVCECVWLCVWLSLFPSRLPCDWRVVLSIYQLRITQNQVCHYYFSPRQTLSFTIMLSQYISRIVVVCIIYLHVWGVRWSSYFCLCPCLSDFFHFSFSFFICFSPFFAFSPFLSLHNFLFHLFPSVFLSCLSLHAFDFLHL